MKIIRNGVMERIEKVNVFIFWSIVLSRQHEDDGHLQFLNLGDKILKWYRQDGPFFSCESEVG